MRSINALSSHRSIKHHPPKPPTSSTTTNNFPSKPPPHKPLTQAESYSFRPSSSSSTLSLNNTNTLCKEQHRKHSNRAHIPIKNFDNAISQCDYNDDDNSNSNHSYYTHKPLSFRRINSYASHNNNSNSRRCNYKQRQCKSNYVNKSYNGMNDNNKGDDYKGIVKELIELLNKELYCDNKVTEWNVLYEVRKLLDKNEGGNKKERIDVYKDYCMELMNKTNISKFDDLKTYINGLISQKEEDRNYMKNLRKMLCEPPKPFQSYKHK